MGTGIFNERTVVGRDVNFNLKMGFSAKLTMHCLLPLVKSKDNIFPDVFINTLSPKVFFKNVIQCPECSIYTI